jgi:hypothetical protein
MIETLILWNLLGVRDDIREEEDPNQWILLIILATAALLWPIGLLLTARRYYKLSWGRSFISTAVITVWILWLIPVFYFVVSAAVIFAGLRYLTKEN